MVTTFAFICLAGMQSAATGPVFIHGPAVSPDAVKLSQSKKEETLLWGGRYWKLKLTTMLIEKSPKLSSLNGYTFYEGRPAFGFDGGLPSQNAPTRQLSTFDVRYGSKTVRVGRTDYDNCFYVNLGRVGIAESPSVLEIWLQGSDAAGAYVARWTIERSGQVKTWKHRNSL